MIIRARSTPLHITEKKLFNRCGYFSGNLEEIGELNSQISGGERGESGPIVKKFPRFLTGNFARGLFNLVVNYEGVRLTDSSYIVYVVYTRRR